MIDEYVKLISCFHQINFCGGKDKTIFQNVTKNKEGVLSGYPLFLCKSPNFPKLGLFKLL